MYLPTCLGSLRRQLLKTAPVEPPISLENARRPRDTSLRESHANGGTLGPQRLVQRPIDEELHRARRLGTAMPKGVAEPTLPRPKPASAAGNTLVPGWMLPMASMSSKSSQCA
ncbi:hypothetical protein CSUB01_09209 [Colletotrichum sublineola]|uniref:Uncharacterized protein n=1 Tax=Colletotrichum sublineola TaxID=1173701 RepID=A0A066XRT2_COLSU|nr:hypothetical protein CSUB01_09209 [Colletotrichum sublineola]